MVDADINGWGSVSGPIYDKFSDGFYYDALCRMIGAIDHIRAGVIISMRDDLK